MITVLLVVIAIELLFGLLFLWSIDKSTYKRLPDDGIKMMSFDPNSGAAKHGWFERR